MIFVQPGVEFDHHKVIDYQPAKARELSLRIERERGLVYEAHSTDYQTPAALDISRPSIRVRILLWYFISARRDRF